ncbi:hypothetical protein [Spirosoma spitsbergense]|uniref:hypothetical protein n=1 Tax=Spirosoma spitsbergense TaxID=431554 RepID=UPI00035FE87C|nr:hypothetical protein [Spirosoma spitsbergense]
MKLISFLAFIGGCTLLVCLIIVIVFGPRAYRFLRKEFASRFPFNWPVWVCRLRTWLTKKGIERDNALTLISFFFVLWLLLVITHPYR